MKNGMEKIYIREIQEEGYMEMKNDNENEVEKNHIREMNEEEYMEMLDEKNNGNEMEKIYIREMNGEGYMEMLNEEENEEGENIGENIGRIILRDPKLDRKIYENDKVRYQINNIYRKCGLNKNKLEEIINDMIRYNYKNEKNENLFEKKLKEKLIDFKLRNNDLEKIEKICENLSKNDFTIPKKYKYKKNLAKFIRRMYREYKWLRTNHFKFLITENFKKIEEIEKIKLNRSGIVLYYNGANKIVCVYFFYLIDNYVHDIIEKYIPYAYNEYESIELYGVLFEKTYLDNRFKDKKIIEELI